MPFVDLSPYDRDVLAAWYAARHLEVDAGLKEIHYLPEGGPERELRFIQVHRRSFRTIDFEPMEFSVPLSDVEWHRLQVIDAGTRSWQAVQRGEVPLPPGWDLAKSTTFRRAVV